MALSRSRILAQGDTPYPHEREAIAFIEENLPNNDPYHVWELIELLEPSTGRQYEIDLIVLGYSAMYLVEIKSGPGRYTGDSNAWWRTPPADAPGAGRKRYMAPPIKSTNHKCKVLNSMLERRVKDRRLVPRIEPLVFLSHEDISVDLDPDGMVGVVTRRTVIDALTKHRFPGSPPNWRGTRIDARQMRELLPAAKAVGLVEQKGRDRVGEYELRDVLQAGETYEDRLAVHSTLPDMRRRARIYLVPQQTSAERRKRLLRAAEREATILLDVRGSRFVLGCADYHADAQRGPTVLFETFDDGLPLEAFLRENPNLTFDERLELVRQLALALGYCHKKGVVHGAVSPDAVLVRRAPETGRVELRLYNFQLATGDRISGTLHGSDFESEHSAVYQAPEVREDASAKSPEGDVFGLGAVAYRIFTGQAPAEDAVALALRLEKDRHLDPRQVEPGLNQHVAEYICLATGFARVERWNDPQEWIDELEDKLTKGEAASTEEVSPLEARPGDIVGGDLLVEGILGEGASARVLRVHREADNSTYALKVSLNEKQDARLQAEAQVLDRLRHARIAPLIEQRVIGERVCLLLGLAGKHTLQRELAQEGAMSLEFAARYGEDLLSALELLEEHGIIHRDLKPANLGVGAAGKAKKHLVLFDFSLANAPVTDLGVGTALYRDPFLRDRRAWDHSADHYSAALTLHEMLTGSRARWGDDEVPATAPESTLQLAAEAFDPSVRDRLTTFFERALARDVDDRFPTASQMRKAWERACEEPSIRPPAPSKTDGMVGNVAGTAAGTSYATASVYDGASEPSEPAYDDATLAALALDAPLESLPLSNRARNALDRAGVQHAAGVLALPDNRLSAIRGAGRKVQKQIHDFREALLRVKGPSERVEPFFPGYRGEAQALGELEGDVLTPGLVKCLADAGLRTLAAVAAAPKPQVVSLVQRAGERPTVLRKPIEAAHRAVDVRDNPGTLQEWVAALLPAKAGKQRTYLEHWLGLREPFEGRADVTVKDLAQHHHVTPANLYTALGKHRSRWSEHPAMPELLRQITAQLKEVGGAVPLRRGEALLRKVLPSLGSTEERDADAPSPAQATALLRMVAEAESVRDAPGLRYVRLRGEPWLLDEGAEHGALLDLGKAADKLAAREVPAAPAEASRKLLAALSGGLAADGPDAADTARSPLASLPAAQLIPLACDASERAACSARLEIYPRQMAPERAVRLTAGVLRSHLSPEQVKARVAARYPEAAPLPDRPELDTLLSPLQILWDEEAGHYRRKGDDPRTNWGTQNSSWTSRYPTAPTGLPRDDSPVALGARDFDQQLRAAIQSDAFRVLGTPVGESRRVAEELSTRHGMQVHSFDELFVAALRERTKAGKPSLDLVLKADAEGPDGPQWKSLGKLAAAAAQAVLAQLVPAQAPCVIAQLGLVHRYQLTDFLQALVAGAQGRDSRAVFLLLPCPETGGAPRLENQMAVPGLLPGQALWVPQAWIRNADNRAA